VTYFTAAFDARSGIGPHHLRQIRASRPTYIVEVLSLLARTIHRNLVRPVEQLSVDPVALDQPVKPVSSTTAALVALDIEHLELANQVAKNDGTLNFAASMSSN
jgi:hypothetical protein